MLSEHLKSRTNFMSVNNSYMIITYTINMSNRLQETLILKIKRCMKLGQKSPEIAQALNISVWTVRKYINRIKKGKTTTETRTSNTRSIRQLSEGITRTYL